MINIDKYIDTVFDELRFCDLDLVSIKAWVWHKVRTNRPFTNRVVFEEKPQIRKQNIWIESKSFLGLLAT